MLSRTPEPDLMDDAAQAQAYADADFSAPHDAFVGHFRRLFPAFATGRVLDLGCGPADITLRFARALPQASFVGIDGAPAMLELGRQAAIRNGLDDRIALEQHYLPDPDLPSQAWDAVVSNSLLHHLNDPSVLWDTVAQVAKPGAPLAVMDLLRPASLDEAAELTTRYADDAPEVLRRDFYNSLLAAYRPDEVRAQLASAGLAHLNIAAVSDRHLLIWGTR
ncbi:MAG: class I SAM-dependent methyltransferase [Sulfuricella sp.]|nr:class I SAM-dependent methyltransferase [Sulfuricella sp.]